MKLFFPLVFLASTAFADECCTRSCWSNGCCDPRQRCRATETVQQYDCVNQKNPGDTMSVIKTKDGIKKVKILPTTSDGT